VWDIDWPSFVFTTIQPERSLVSPEVLLGGLASILGAIVGGSVNFFTLRHFRRNDQRKLFEINSYALYVTITETLNDVHSISSPIHDNLEKNGWPLNPWTVMGAFNSAKEPTRQVSAEQLATFRGAGSGDLSHNTLQLLSIRNQIVAITHTYNNKRLALQEKLGKRGKIIGPNNRVEIELSSADDQELIIEINAVDRISRDLLKIIELFYTEAETYCKIYNDFKSSHPVKKIQKAAARFRGCVRMASKKTRNRRVQTSRMMQFHHAAAAVAVATVFRSVF